MTAPKSVSIGQRLKDLRDQAALSQQDLAERAGMSWSVIAHIEQGRTKNPRINTMKALAKALGVSLTHLIEGE